MQAYSGLHGGIALFEKQIKQNLSFFPLPLITWAIAYRYLYVLHLLNEKDKIMTVCDKHSDNTPKSEGTVMQLPIVIYLEANYIEINGH